MHLIKHGGTCTVDRPRNLNVFFHVIEPGVTKPGAKAFKQGAFPLSETLDVLRALDPADESTRVAEDLFDSQSFCIVHDDGPGPIVGIYRKENFARPLVEYKGTIEELILRDGEGLVDSSYAAFFPEDVVGIARTSTKAPGASRLSQWITIHTDYSVVLPVLTDVDALRQLQAKQGLLRRLDLRIRRGTVRFIRGQSGTAKALRAAADANRHVDEIVLGLRSNKRGHESGLVSQEIQEALEDLLPALPEFEEAKVWVSGQKKEINLLRKSIAHQANVSLDGNTQIGPSEAADALFRAYEAEQNTIRESVAAIRESR